ncbi:hypothetical protein ACF3DV_08995 [Chlorogloeopsis fritschii PCC 9212]|uniref:hypothetical protein n=1 Tax=Chlorogloeopsis fritschii TaxID=1124 RepID=UPI00370D44A1
MWRSNAFGGNLRTLTGSPPGTLREGLRIPLREAASGVYVTETAKTAIPSPPPASCDFSPPYGY